MEVFADEQQLCPCYKECQEFQKLAEIKDSGLVIYYHRISTDNIRQAIESAENISRDVFILHNKGNVKVTTSELSSALDKKNISCPRCRKSFKHAQKLFREVKSIDRKIVMSICDHCHKRVLGGKKQICACEKTVKLFKSVKGEQGKDLRKKHKAILPSKTGQLCKGLQKQKEILAYSDTQINKVFHSPASRHESKIYELFKSGTLFESDDTEIREFDSKEGQAVAFDQSIKLSLVHTSTSTVTSNSGATFVTTYLPKSSIKTYKQENIFEDTPSIDAKEELKRRHDFSLRQMVRLDKNSGISFSGSKQPHVFETPKLAPWDQEDPSTKNLIESKIYRKKIPTKHGLGPQNRDYVSNELIIFGSSRNTLRNLRYSYFKSSKHDNTIKKERIASENRSKKPQDVLTDLQLARSVNKEKNPDQHVSISKSVPIESVGNVLKPQFSFFFPKAEERKEKQLNLTVSSSELIKETQTRYHLQYENLIKARKEEEDQEKLKREQKKNLAREGKKLKDDEEKSKVVKLQKKNVADLEKRQVAELEKIQAAELEKRQVVELEKRKSENVILDKVGEFSVAEKDTISKPKQNGKQQVREEAKTKDKTEEKVEVVEKQQTLKSEEAAEIATEEETFQIDEEEVILTKKEEKLKSDEREELIALKRETDKKLQRVIQEPKEKSKQIEILRDKYQKKGKQKFTNEELILKEKGATVNAGKTIKINRNTFRGSEIARSNIDKSINDENINISEKKKKGKISAEKESSETRKDWDYFFKLKAIHLKEKQNALIKKNKLELEELKAKQESEQKTNIDAQNNKVEGSKTVLKQAKIKQAKKPRAYDINHEVIKVHKRVHDQSGQKSPVCPICLDSELELDISSLHYKRKLKKYKTDIIIGEKIYKNKPRTVKTKAPCGIPILFQKDLHIEPDQLLNKKIQLIMPETETLKKNILATASSRNNAEQINSDRYGIIRYALSDRTFIDKGWTVLPTEKIVRKMNVYRMRPAHPEFDWFKHNKDKRLMTYDTGEKLAEFDANGRGRWYYRNGRLALDYYDTEEANDQQRFVIYSSGEPDERGRTHPITVLATFDYLGNGIVLDHAGKIRLKYNQTEGVVLDRTIGPASHWKWHTLNDPPVLQQVMIDTQLAHKDPHIAQFESPVDKTTRTKNEEMLAIEFENFVKEKRKKLSQTFKPFQIKMKALKINEHFSLKVLDQATVYLIFRDGLTNLKVNMGMKLDDKEIVDTDISEVGVVSNSLEGNPARTESLAALQRKIAYAQRYERQHAERERWLRRPEPCASADLLTAAASSPLRLPLRTVPEISSTTTENSSGKPSTNNSFYDTNLRC